MPLTRPSELSRFETLLAEVSSRLAGVHGEGMDAAIRDALRTLAAVLTADRSSLFEFSADGTRFETSYWWAAEGVPPTGDITTSDLPWYAARLAAGETICLERVFEELPEEASRERDYIAAAGIKSNLTVPISLAGRVVCALAAGTFREHRSWPPAVVERVKLFGQVLAAAVYRRRQERALEASHAEIERLSRRLQRENLYLREEIRADRHSDEIVGVSPAMRRALEAAEQVAGLGSTVLILGETGTGKELLARLIHERSARRERPLVRLNCAALPAGLVESELFGHEKGAFTGAGAPRPGRFEVADRGTLFLDEVGDLPLEAQAKLLRVLQEGEFERLGSTRTRRVDVRIVAATHRDLQAAVHEGRFREDLYYRLSVFPIAIPPLRERPEDVEPIVSYLVHRRQKELGRRIESIAPESLETLRRYAWPGNVRELENVIERALVLSSGSVLELADALATPLRPAAGKPPSRDLDAVQRAHIEQVLAECGWRINGRGNAAERLGVHPNTLRFRMKKLGIARPGSRRAAPPPAGAE